MYQKVEDETSKKAIQMLLDETTTNRYISYKKQDTKSNVLDYCSCTNQPNPLFEEEKALHADNSIQIVQQDQPDLKMISSQQIPDPLLSSKQSQLNISPMSFQTQEILQAINSPNQILVKSKPKFEPNSVYSDARKQSNRGSQFRGVSRNGKKWQVMIMGKSKKQYIGAIEDESEAALIYDWHAICILGKNEFLVYEGPFNENIRGIPVSSKI
ncbi:ant-like protein [Stylonychia lemnae]|uniref:Ant-like protein n=1 Tax=Stylonychia lemnae TaxID=5949 RepID=A0A078AZK0_STYLE|nr:ant-like protein [Stylonychia lemnae]|eukprot:CDW87865.1 ant-like protein [Stylonychia lemnae]